MNTRSSILAVIGACLLVAEAAQGVDRTWDGGASDAKWSNPTNWDGDASVPTDGDNVTIGSTGGGVTLTNATPLLGTFSISNNTLTFSDTTNLEAVLRASNVVVKNLGTLTHAVNATTNAPWLPNARVCLLCTNLTILAGGKIDVNSKGYQAGCGPGRGAAGAGAWYGGGGYGGEGGIGNATAGTAGQPYGSLSSPVAPGSGGGRGTPNACAYGGGWIFVNALGHVCVNGSLLAAGANSPGGGDGTGAGSGGGIYVTCRTFGGTNGIIRADGGLGTTISGAGGGGRIAIHYDTTEQAVLAQPPNGMIFSANAGTGPYFGRSGTMWFSDSSFFPTETLEGGRAYVSGMTSWSPTNLSISKGLAGFLNAMTLTVTGNVVLTDFGGLEMTNSTVSIGGSMLINNANTREPLSYIYGGSNASFTVNSNLVINRATVLLYGASNSAAFLHVGADLIMTNSADLYVYAAMTNEATTNYGARVLVDGNLCLSNSSWIYPVSHSTDGGSPKFIVQNLTISGTNSGFNASYAGFQGGTGPGTGSIGSGAWYGGGGYGGKGGLGNGTPGTGGASYGSSNAPILPGSGGGKSNGKYGGGVIWIEATRQITLDGTLATYGGNVSDGTGAAAGAGGGIYINCQTLAGTNAILQANGGSGGSYLAGCGGGGRVAIWRVPRFEIATTSTWSVAVNTGSGTYTGGVGTVCWEELPGPPMGTVLVLK
jgi:hypothetical protein